MIRDELTSLNLDEEQLDRLEKFYRLVIDQNRVMNLTTITEPHEFAIKHVIDSLTAWDDEHFKDVKSIADIGTGAGFPAVPLKIFRPQIKFTLIDSTLKRVEFLRRVVTELELEGVEVIHGRAEELARIKTYRGQFDAVTSRAVARLNILAEYCLPFVKVGGVFVAMKGKNFREELDEARASIKILGGGRIFVREVSLPTLEDKRSVIYVDKSRATPDKFPRRESVIRTKQLGKVN